MRTIIADRAGKSNIFLSLYRKKKICGAILLIIDDIVEGIVRVIRGAPEKRNGEDGLPLPPYAVYNIGGGQPENLLDFVTVLQEELVRANAIHFSGGFRKTIQTTQTYL